MCDLLPQQSLRWLLSFMKQWQLWENSLWKIVRVIFLAAVHAVILTSMFVLLWRYKALGVYSWFGMCSFSVLVYALDGGGSTGLPPLRQCRFIAIMIVITASIRCFWLGRRERCAISQHEDHLDSICIFIVWNVWVCMYMYVCPRRSQGHKVEADFVPFVTFDLWDLMLVYWTGDPPVWQMLILSLSVSVSLSLYLRHKHISVYVQPADYPAGRTLLLLFV